MLAGACPRNKNQTMVRGFEFLVTGPESRANHYSFTSASYVHVDLPERRFQVAPCGWYRIALYPVTRLVAEHITKMNGINPNLGLSQESCYGSLRKKA